MNKTISDHNQIRLDANKRSANVKLEPNERKVGQYILGKSIGEGTFGKVKLGRHITTNEKVSFPFKAIVLLGVLTLRFELFIVKRWPSRFSKNAKLWTWPMSSECPVRSTF